MWNSCEDNIWIPGIVLDDVGIVVVVDVEVLVVDGVVDVVEGVVEVVVVDVVIVVVKVEAVVGSDGGGSESSLKCQISINKWIFPVYKFKLLNSILPIISLSTCNPFCLL